MTIYFDMDGTIADLYGVENWLDMLVNGDATPYAVAKPLIDMMYFCELCEKLQAVGYKIGIVSWLAKNSTKEYDKAVRQAKKEWLQQNITFTFDEIHIVKYGTRKNYVVSDKMGILFDDEIQNRENWKGNSYKETEIFTVLEGLR